MVSIRLLLLLVLFCLLSIIVRLFYIQVLRPQVHAARYLNSQKVNPERGKILDRNEEVLATNKTEYLLFVEPKNIEEEDKLIEAIDEVTELGEATVEARIDKSKDWVSIKSGLTREERNKLLQHNLEAIGFEEQTARSYPESSLSAHLIGFVGKDSVGEPLGYFGVEGYYHRELAGIPGFIKSERDVAGKPIFVGTQEFLSSENGRDLVLTIDKSVQNIVKRKIKDGVEKYKAASGCAIAADPFTMEILGWACVPDFDPEQYYEFTEKDFRNTAVSDVYEPGSTFKPLIVAAAIQEGKIKADSTFDEKSHVTIDGYKIKNWDDTYKGTITMTEVLEKSSNVGMVHIGEQLGSDLLYEYLQRYRFGELTAIDLEGEVTGPLKSQDNWYPLDYASATFGQGIAITQLQLVRAFSSLVNGGNLMKPYIVKEIRDNKQKPRTRSPQVVEKLFSEETSNMVKEMLVSTVEESTADIEKPEGYKIGGKTGTAQVAFGGNYDASKTIASFIGFAPAERPEFIVLVVLKEPGVSSWGSETAAPVFFEIAKDLLVHYNIPPSESPSRE